MPVPEGPDRTMGRSFDEEGWDVGAIVENVLILKDEEGTTKDLGYEVGKMSIETVRRNVEASFGPTENSKLE